MTTASRILLVDDSAAIRGLLHKIIDGEPDLEVVATAANGKAGVEKVDRHNPDLVVMDVEMPIMTGLEAVAEITKRHPKLPVIMFSSLTEAGAAATIEALANGAADYAAKPTATGGMSAAIAEVQASLLAKIRALLEATAPKTSRRPAPKPLPRRNGSPAPAPKPVPAAPAGQAAPALRQSPVGSKSIDAVVIGCSTGGPVALEKVVVSLKPALPVPVFVVQHMPPKFTKTLADRINRAAVSEVSEGMHGVNAKAGHIYIAPGDRHMDLTGTANVQVVLSHDKPINSCVPSVDPLFMAAAKVYGNRVLGVMLTGMGADGLEGTRALAKAGCSMIAQDEETSVVWGMPGAVTNAGLATEVLPLDQIASSITTKVMASRSTRQRAGATT